MRSLLLCAAIVSWALASDARAAHAGVDLTTELSDMSAAAAQSRPPNPGRILLDGNRLRMELTRPDGRHAVLIFRGDRNVMWSLDEKHRTYTEVDRARMQALVAQSDATRKQMEKDFDKVPPEKRMEMLRLLAQGAPKKKREPPTIRPTGRTDKVGGVPCHEVEVLRDGEKRREVCVADWTAAGVTKEDLAALRDLNEFEDDTVGTVGGRAQDDALELFEMLDGLPVRVRTFRAGQPRTELRVVKVAREAIAPSLFEVPAGYAKREFRISMPSARHLPPGTGASSGGVLPPGRK